MNRKKFYQDFIRLKYYLATFLISVILCCATTLVIFLLNTLWMQNIITRYLYVVAIFFLGTATIIIFRLFCIIINEIKYRNKYDKVSNFLKSIIQTLKIRHFLKRTSVRPSSEKTDATIIDFNKSVSKLYIDIHRNKITLIIALPLSQQAKTTLDETLPDIRETISQLNNGYYFSSPIRKNNYYIISGSKN